MVRKTEPIMTINNDPEPEYVVPLTAKEEKDSFMLMHPLKKCNGVQYVVAREGDTYSNVAFRLNVRERDLREYNDALGRELQKGDRIFLASKKNTGANEYVWSFTGQSLWALSQEEGVHIEAIQKWNGLDPQIRTFRTRQKIYLKKVKE
jgi:LysM repeat protein